MEALGRIGWLGLVGASEIFGLLAGAMFFKLRATAGITVGGEGEVESRGEEGERCWLWGEGVRDEEGCRGRGVKRDLGVENELQLGLWN